MSNRIAFDRASVRSFDQDGRLQVEITNISKANVCPYYGREIPDAEMLGLDPDRVYQLLRDPDELAKGAPTFNSLPLMLQHVPVSADEPQKQLIVGTTGSDAGFDAPYLKNSLKIWDQRGIDLIESGEQKELSCGYRYRADMTPGTYEGVKYDGVMRDIEGNHVALVAEGRAGSDVVVGDSKLETAMSKNKLSLKGAVAKGALAVYLRPRLANDARIDLSYVLKDVTSANWKASKPKIANDIKLKAEGKLAKDADIEGLVDLLDSLDGEEPEEAPDSQEIPAKDEDHSEEDEEAVWRQIYEAIRKMLGREPAAPAQDEPAAPEEAEKMPERPPEKDEDEKKVTQAAMDAAISSAVKKTETATIARLNAIHEAREMVRPHVGELKGPFDSAADVFKYALDAAKVDTTGVPPEAFRVMVKMLPRSDSHRPADVAMDSAGSADAAKNLGALGEVTIM